MTRRKIARAAVLVAVLGAAAHASPALAGHHEKKEQVPASYPALMKMSPTDVMHMIDKDGKGYVTKDEFLKFQATVFDRIDRDRDGRLGEPEFTDAG